MKINESRTEYRGLGDLLRKGNEEVYGDHACYLRAKYHFYANRHAEHKKPWSGWWDMPMAKWAWQGDARWLHA